MGKSYQLSFETVKTLAGIEGTARNFTMVLFAFLLVVHLVISSLLDLIGWLSPGPFLFGVAILLGFLVYLYFRGERYFYRYYSSYRVELSDQSVILNKMNKAPVEILRDEIKQITELIPEGELYIKGARGNQIIDIYALLHKENPELKNELIKTKEPDRSDFNIPKLAAPVLTIFMALFAPFCFIRGFEYPELIMPGLSLVGLSIIFFFKLRQWPVLDPRIKSILRVIFIPAIISIPLLLIDLIFLAYSVVISF